MTREDLAQKINSFERDNRKWEWPFLAVYIGGVLAIGLWMARWADQSSAIAGVALLFAWIIFPSLLFGRINKRRMRSFGLYCPSCNISLTGPVGRLAVTTLYCSHCGKQIIEESEQAVAPNRILARGSEDK